MGKREGGSRTKGFYRESNPGKPLVSVVTVVLNGEKHLEQTIRSVLGQTYENIEYIIIDGGSTDSTLDIIAGYDDRIDYWVSEQDRGIYDAMNKGIELARGELIGIINSDDFYEPDAIESVVHNYLMKPGPQVLFGHTFVLYEAICLKYKAYGRLRSQNGMMGFYHPAMFTHRAVYEEFGGYDEIYRIAADYEFVMRVERKGVRFTPVDDFLVTYRGGGASAADLRVTLSEIKAISCKYRGMFSFLHSRFLLSFYRSMFFYIVQKVIRPLGGDRLLNRARIMYLKHVIATGSSKRVETISRVDDVQ